MEDKRRKHFPYGTSAVVEILRLYTRMLLQNVIVSRPELVFLSYLWQFILIGVQCNL